MINRSSDRIWKREGEAVRRRIATSRQLSSVATLFFFSLTAQLSRKSDCEGLIPARRCEHIYVLVAGTVAGATRASGSGISLPRSMDPAKEKGESNGSRFPFTCESWASHETRCVRTPRERAETIVDSSGEKRCIPLSVRLGEKITCRKKRRCYHRLAVRRFL